MSEKYAKHNGKPIKDASGKPVKASAYLNDPDGNFYELGEKAAQTRIYASSKKGPPRK